MSREEKDKKNKQAGIFFSVGTHIALILLFIFLVAWRAPNPPLPEFGIELNFGTSDQGTGDVQPETTPAEAEQEEDALPDTPEEIQEEAEEAVDQPAETAETNVADVLQEEVTTQDSPDVVEQPKGNEEVKKVEKKPPPVLYPGKKDGDSGKTGDAKQAESANHGDDTNKTGDKGDEKGTIDSRALYGKLGGGGDSMLEMTGWMWDNEPDPKETTSQSGKIVFEVILDEKGNVTYVEAKNYTVSASLVRIYQAEVEKLTFSPTSSGTPPPSSKGKITFIIKAK